MRIEIGSTATDALDELVGALPAQGMKARRRVVVEALVYGVTPAQASGMIRDFVRKEHGGRGGSGSAPVD